MMTTRPPLRLLALLAGAALSFGCATGKNAAYWRGYEDATKDWKPLATECRAERDTLGYERVKALCPSEQARILREARTVERIP